MKDQQIRAFVVNYRATHGGAFPTARTVKAVTGGRTVTIAAILRELRGTMTIEDRLVEVEASWHSQLESRGERNGI